MLNFFKILKPPAVWKIPVIVLSGIFLGLAVYVFQISEAASYLGDEPKTCVNCHIMAPQYATWNHSAHRQNVTCNDCHVPQDNFFRKYYFKAKDGLRHATIFTLRKEPQVIFIKDEGKKVVQENCIRCHSNLITDDKLLKYTSDFHHDRTIRNCNECHRETPHGRVNSLSSVPNARVPLPDSPYPNFIKELLNNK